MLTTDCVASCAVIRTEIGSMSASPDTNGDWVSEVQADAIADGPLGEGVA